MGQNGALEIQMEMGEEEFKRLMLVI